MGKGIKIDIKRTGFPVKVGDMDLWFDSSLENLRRFFDIEKIATDKLKIVQEKAKHIHFPDENEIKETDDIDVKTVDAAFDLQKEYIAIQYDILFGEGKFKEIYKEYPDIIALENVLDPIGRAIAKKIGEMEEEREKVVEDKKSEYLKKKAIKK